jgi:N6-L-threonylcarbamoyladenine synthase
MDEEIAERKRVFSAGPLQDLEAIRAVTPQRTLDLVASFQQTVIDELMSRALRAAEEEPVQSIIVSGGVAANAGLRNRFASIRYPFYFPTLALSTDNAAMIAAAGYPHLVRGGRSDFSVKAQPSLAL